MNEQQMMGWVLCAVLWAGGGLLCLRLMAVKQKERAGLGVYALGLMVYALFAVGFSLMIQTGMGEGMVLPAVMLLMAFAVIVSGVRWLAAHGREMHGLIFVLMILYMGIMGYITVFSRESQSGLDIQLKLEAIRQALAQASFLPLRHFLQNLVMFVPLGLLLPLLNPERKMQPALIAGAALLLTASIEGVQLIFRMGQVDVGDVLANFLGACAGYGLYALMFLRKKAA